MILSKLRNGPEMPVVAVRIENDAYDKDKHNVG